MIINTDTESTSIYIFIYKNKNILNSTRFLSSPRKKKKRRKKGWWR